MEVTVDGIATVAEGTVELFRVFWPPDPNLVQARPGLAMVAMKRSASGGGVLLVMPAALIPAGSLPVSATEAQRVVGAHTRFEAPAVRINDSPFEHIGIELDVQVVDIAAEGLIALQPLSALPESDDLGIIGFGEDLDIIPDPEVVMEKVESWIAGQTSQRVVFYSADEMPEAAATELPGLMDNQELDGVPMTPPSPAPALPQRPKAAAKDPAKPKRATTAALAQEVSQIMSILPTLSEQLVSIQNEQREFRRHMEESRTLPPPRPGQVPVANAVSNFAKMIGPPPKCGSLQLSPPSCLCHLLAWMPGCSHKRSRRR